MQHSIVGYSASFFTEPQNQHRDLHPADFTPLFSCFYFLQRCFCGVKHHSPLTVPFRRPQRISPYKRCDRQRIFFYTFTARWNSPGTIYLRDLPDWILQMYTLASHWGDFKTLKRAFYLGGGLSIWHGIKRCLGGLCKLRWPSDMVQTPI